MPDIPHLVKNLESALVRVQTFTIPPDMVEKENLSSNEVSVGPLKNLVDFQETQRRHFPVLASDIPTFVMNAKVQLLKESRVFY